VSEPRWLIEARKHVGLREIPGPRHEPTITRWLSRLKAWWSDDETPWCGTLVAACLIESGLPVVREWYRARSWAAYGTPLILPTLGCIVVFERTGGGHVGFVVGDDERGRLMVLGGNQGNAVSIAPFDRSRVLAYRWPPGEPAAGPMPVLVSNSQPASSNEA
jgi:uncharacterized protein (TIGR02594 family)